MFVNLEWPSETMHCAQLSLYFLKISASVFGGDDGEVFENAGGVGHVRGGSGGDGVGAVVCCGDGGEDYEGVKGCGGGRGGGTVELVLFMQEREGER